MLGFHRAVTAMVCTGNSVLIGHVLRERHRLSGCLNLFAGGDVVLVGVHGPLPERGRRESAVIELPDAPPFTPIESMPTPSSTLNATLAQAVPKRMRSRSRHSSRPGHAQRRVESALDSSYLPSSTTSTLSIPA